MLESISDDGWRPLVGLLALIIVAIISTLSSVSPNRAKGRGRGGASPIAAQRRGDRSRSGTPYWRGSPA